jgi:dTDP-4-dehydrorhamnose 3,5-epimerase
MIKKTGIDGLMLIEPKVFGDDRGYFFESYSEKAFQDEGLNYSWVQDNESFSSRGVLRGMHYQVGNMAQAKLVRVVQGEVLDVVVDLRKDSPSFGQHFSEILSGDNKRQMLIPRGFAHGFIVLSDHAIFAYKCDNFYAPDSEESIHPLDPSLDIDWILPKDLIQMSSKDERGLPFDQHTPSGC